MSKFSIVDIIINERNRIEVMTSTFGLASHEIERHFDVANSPLGKNIVAASLGEIFQHSLSLHSVKVIDNYGNSDTVAFKADRYSKDALAVAVGKQVRKIK